jgi:hypothetical protein
MIILDTEVFQNYWLLAMLDTETGKISHAELHEDKPTIDSKALLRKLTSTTLVGFNIEGYDLPVITMALHGKSTQQIKALSDELILSGKPNWQVLKERNITIPKGIDYIDIMNVAPSRASLKQYGARLGARKLQDLPFDPAHEVLLYERETILLYCENDLRLTKALYDALTPEVELRKSMSKQYGVDVRSKSDAQIAEVIIRSELEKVTGKTYYKPDPSKLPTSFYYRSPKIVSFTSEQLNAIYYRILRDPFEINSLGRIDLPKWLKNTVIKIGDTEYSMGIGGLHSKEKSQCLRAEGDYLISDFDVSSFYPSIILQQKLFPKSLGESFLAVYKSLVKQRLIAKKNNNITEANTKKIALNGTFGKLGSIYSFLYAPDLLIQVTITGQLSLLMLIERLELAGISVKSANTDGIVCYYRTDQRRLLEEIIWNWELDTTYELEESEYKILASRDVNNYVAITRGNKVKTKGVFAPSFYASDKPTQFMLSKNPDRYAVSLAVIAYLQHGTPIEETILLCKDIRHFISVTKVTGGAVWRGKEIGKTIRFYNSTDVPKDEAILYALNGNRVGTTAGCKPLMDLPDEFPSDIAYCSYIDEANKLLRSTGAMA